MANNTRKQFFLEILREKTPSSEFSGNIKPQSEIKKLQFERISRQEKIIYTAKDKSLLTSVTKLENELNILAGSIKHLDQKIQIAVINTQKNPPGEYHVNFILNLIHLVKSITKKVDLASEWLGLSLARGKKKSLYWNKVKSCGTKYLLSADRYASTQSN